MKTYEMAENRQSLQSNREAWVLLVEDDIINQEILKLLLDELGVEVSVADNGLQALEMLNAQRFDLVFMDVQMPVMDGISATVEIRENPLLQDLPIIAMTSDTKIEDLESILAAGMNDYLIKPVEDAELDRIFLQWLVTENDSQETNENNQLTENDLLKSILSQVSGIDVEQALKYLGNKPDFLLNLLLQFKKENVQTAAQLKSLLMVKNWAELKFKVHGLKGVCACFRADELHKMAAELEQALIAANTAEAEKLTLSFVVALEKMLVELEKLTPTRTLLQQTSATSKINPEQVKLQIAELIHYLKTGELNAQQSASQLQCLLAGYTQYDELIKQLNADIQEINYPEAIEVAMQLLSLFSKDFPQ